MCKYEVGFYIPVPGCNKVIKCPIRRSSLLKSIFTYIRLPFMPCCRGRFYKLYIEKLRSVNYV